MGSLSIWHWLIVLVVVVLIFGTKKLRNLGTDLGGAVKGFKDGMPPSDTASRRSANTSLGALNSSINSSTSRTLFSPQRAPFAAQYRRNRLK